MLVHIGTLLLALCLQTLSAHPSDARSDKPLFVPHFSNYPTLIQHTPYQSYGSLESASLYSHYGYDHGQHELDSLQRQSPYQDTEKRLENFLFAGKPKKTPLPPQDQSNEDDYKQKPNKISSQSSDVDTIKPHWEDYGLEYSPPISVSLDDTAGWGATDTIIVEPSWNYPTGQKSKRSLTYTSWTPPTLSSTNNLDDRVLPPASRSVPFGPYTTWLPLEGPLVGYASGAPTVNPKPTKGSSLKKTSRRRRREIIYADKEDHLTVPPQPLFYHQDYIPVPIAYSTPIIRNVPHMDAVAAVSPLNSFYSGKLSASLDTIMQNPELAAVSYNVVRKK